MANQESNNGCQPCQDAVEIIRRAYQNAPTKTKTQAMERVFKTIDEVRGRVGCSQCPVNRGNNQSN